MRNVKVLQMLEDGKVDELKAELRDEIYKDSLKQKPDVKRRYTAMKKYFYYHTSERECLKKPCKIMFEGKPYTSFTNSWSLVLTTEDTGEMELFDNENGKYPDVGRLVNFNGIKRKVDLNAVFAEVIILSRMICRKENSMNDEKPDSNKCGDCFYCYKLYGNIWCAKYRTTTSPDTDACGAFRKPLRR